jgi:hypothetical protein
MPNMSTELVTKTALEIVAGTPLANTISTIPAASAKGKVVMWIHPRHVGFTSWGSWSSESSSSGMCRGLDSVEGVVTDSL